MKKANCVFLIGLILFLNLFSLNSTHSSQSSNPLESASDSVDDPLKVGTTSLGYDLDPAYAWDSASFDIIDQVWEGLYAYNLGDPRLRIIPRLAADCGSWNENATVFNVTLRSGITFHNGEPFTATDVNYTFSRLWELCVYHDNQIRDLYFPYGFNTTEMNASVGYGYIINRTVIVDESHVSFELNFPYSPFQSLLCFSGSYIVDESTTNIDKYLEFGNINNRTAIGTGPYICTNHTSDFVTFEYFEDYYRGVPAIKKFKYIKYPDSNEISEALLDQDIDLGGWNRDYIQDFIDAGNFYIGPYRHNSIIRYLHMNNEKINRTYRHAINFAIDRNNFSSEMYGPLLDVDQSALRMTSFIPPGIKYHKDCDVPIFNITKSRQILIDAGYTVDHGLDETSTDEDWKNVAEHSPLLRLNYYYWFYWRLNDYAEYAGNLIKDYLKNIGIHVNVQSTTTTFTGPHNIFEGDIWLMGWMPDYNDPSNYINPLLSNTSSRGKYTNIDDPWFQNAIEEALTITNDDDRKELYHNIQDYIATDLMPVVFLYNRLSIDVRPNYVITQRNSMGKFYVFPFSWHGVNTTFNDPYLELWCDSGSPPVHEYWPEPSESISSYPMMVFSICFLVSIPICVKLNKKKLRK